MSFLESGATSTWLFRVGLVRALSPQPSYDNDDFLTFVLTSSSSFSFFIEHPLTVRVVPSSWY